MRASLNADNHCVVLGKGNVHDDGEVTFSEGRESCTTVLVT